MKIIVWGGDGFCGWPAALHFSNCGHEVIIADNLSRRKIDVELGIESLTPIASIMERLFAWQEVSGKNIEFRFIDAAYDYDQVLQLICSVAPDAMIHFAEQRAAPYSMKSSVHKRYTVNNNTNATHNILAAIVESELDIHLVHLGSMGVYGYGDVETDIPEGYLPVCYSGDDGQMLTQEILYPMAPGSVYHMTKCLDQVLFAYYASNDQLRITDLHQGIVWGTQTMETKCDERLINRFDYDGDYGTVLNRFLLQAAIGYPLTVHGNGGQTRAFIHIQDTVRCIELALKAPPSKGERVKIINQLTETHTVYDLAQLISQMTNSSVQFMPSPRIEKEKNTLRASNACFINAGLRPITLEKKLLQEVVEIAGKYKSRCNTSKIPCVSFWNKELQI